MVFNSEASPATHTRVLPKSVNRLNMHWHRSPLDADLRHRESSHDDVQLWNGERLRCFLQSNFGNDQLIVASHRQPYSHVRIKGGVRLMQPASGLVTAMEPVMRARGGTWVAHASGNADCAVVDDDGVWTAPADAGAYRLRRLWFNEKEEAGHLDGFSNAGLWPLCHEANRTRQLTPRFTESDWQSYRRVNQAYADAIVNEARCANPVVMVHDYQLALLPAMVRAALPKATVIGFWHIPWADYQQMSLCPWLPELITGWLGSNVAGFQTRAHRDNFLASARAIGKRPSSVTPNAVQAERHATLVGEYPVSIAWPVQTGRPSARAGTAVDASAKARRDMRLIVGIDRFDYTKGLLERLLALELLLLEHPEWQGRVRLIQVAAPTRTALLAYKVFRTEVQREVARINLRFTKGDWQPVTLLDTLHNRDEVDALYRSADVCLVTSLQDGMNLVCKEFVAARSDEQGVLVLSRFAGASEELEAALIVDPRDPAQVSDALHQALHMPLPEAQKRMRALRRTVQKNNVHRWAASLFLDAARQDGRRQPSRPAAVSIPAAAPT